MFYGPGGINDPETAWEGGEPEEPLPAISVGQFLLLEPGEEPRLVDALPKPRNFKFGIGIGWGELVVCVGKRRSWCRTPLGHSTDHVDAPLAERLVVVFVELPMSGNPMKPNRYLVVAGSGDELLGWLDYTYSSTFDARVLRCIADASGMNYHIERFPPEPEFERAHPGWVD